MANRYLSLFEAQITQLTGTALADYPVWGTQPNVKYAYDDTVRGKAGGDHADKVFRCTLAHTAAAGNEPGESGGAGYWKEEYAGFLEGINQFQYQGQGQPVNAGAGYDPDYTLSAPGTKSGTLGYVVELNGAKVQKLLVEGAQFVIKMFYGGSDKVGTQWDQMQITLGAANVSPQLGQPHTRSFPFTIQGDVTTGYVA